MVCLRLDELRHRLIPLYSYDPAEEQEWGDEGDDNELNVSERNNSSTLSKAEKFILDEGINETKNDVLHFLCARNLYTRKVSCCSPLPMEAEHRQC